MSGSDSEDEVGYKTWDTWEHVLSPLAQLELYAGKLSHQEPGRARADGALRHVYKMALEIRDRLRFSQHRVRDLKRQLQGHITKSAKEQRQAEDQISDLERQATHLIHTGQAQMAQISEQQAQLAELSSENRQLKQHINALTLQLGQAQLQASHATAAKEQCAWLETDNSNTHKQLQDTTIKLGNAESRASFAEQDREQLVEEVGALRKQLSEAQSMAQMCEGKHSELLGNLLANKSRLSELSHIEALYTSARDELARLEKENGELKDMMAHGVTELGHSRILEGLLPAKPKSMPMFLTPQMYGKRCNRRGRRNRGQLVSPSEQYGSMVLYSDLKQALQKYCSKECASPGRGGLVAPTVPTDLPNLAFLGPPTAAYPQDPEKFIYVRVAGGFMPKYVGHHELPKASGWVPRDVVRVLQAFRHSYGLELEWRYWEPLLLLIDEVYRSRQHGSVTNLKASHKEKMKLVKRRLSSAVSYPSVLQTGKIGYLQRKVAAMRHAMAATDHSSDRVLLHMAQKDYHLGHQLDQAVDENLVLRQSLTQLDQLHYQTPTKHAAYTANGAHAAKATP